MFNIILNLTLRLVQSILTFIHKVPSKEIYQSGGKCNLHLKKYFLL
jgi:hypothetical protein